MTIDLDLLSSIRTSAFLMLFLLYCFDDGELVVLNT